MKIIITNTNCRLSCEWRATRVAQLVNNFVSKSVDVFPGSNIFFMPHTRTHLSRLIFCFIFFFFIVYVFILARFDSNRFYWKRWKDYFFCLLNIKHPKEKGKRERQKEEEEEEDIWLQKQMWTMLETRQDNLLMLMLSSFCFLPPSNDRVLPNACESLQIGSISLVWAILLALVNII